MANATPLDASTSAAVSDSSTGPSIIAEGGRNLAKLGFGTKLAYGAGAVVEGVFAQAIAVFLFFYATAVCGLPSAMVGIALAIGLLLDAMVDPLIGSTSDAWRSRFGRRLPFMLFGLPIVALCLILAFSLPSGLSQTMLFVWLSVVLICLRIGMSLFFLPYNAVGAELSDDQAERSSIVAWRWIAQIVGSLITVVLGFGVFFNGAGGLMNRSAYPAFGMALAALLVTAGLISSRAVYLTIYRQHPAPPREKKRHLAFANEVTEIFRNQSFRVLFFGAILLYAALAINATLSIHANTYFWKLAPSQIQLVTLALPLGLLIGTPLAAPMMKIMEKRTVIFIGEIGLGLAFAGPVALRLLGLLPATGDRIAMILAASVFAGGMLLAAAAIAFNSMMADAADEHEHIFGARREGLYYAGWSFALKAATGLGSLVAGVGLQFIGYENAGHSVTAGKALSPETIYWLGALHGLGAGILTLVGALIVLLYRLSYKKHHGIMLDLAKRRNSADLPVNS
jgi:glycoside/pentoside/hexuronide:cation symporter, GPH family